MVKVVIVVILGIIGLVGIMVSVYNMSNSYSDVKVADKQSVEACKELKTATVDLGNALRNTYRTTADIHDYYQTVNHYNSECGQKTGILPG